MPILKKFEKQPNEIQDYDIYFDEWLSEFGDNDTGVSHTATVPVGITKLQSTLISGSRVKVWLSGGTTGRTYKVTVTLTTAGGRVKEAEIEIKVKEV